ncbi:MAG: hypothetical protein BGO04_06005 [Microbacterium sp. 70-38]|nr:MAG: hypothetical protein BGO04_06005 [Microbacterium sp. 70-38]
MIWFVSLELIRREFLPDRSGAWLDVLEFESLHSVPDDQMLAAVIESPWYHHDYASPRGDEPEPAPHDIHGPYQLDHVKAEEFVPSRPASMKAEITDWLDTIDAEPGFAIAVRDTLARLVPPDSRIYRLPALGEDKMHVYGWVVGTSGFHEFVILGEDARRVTVVVASDD